MIDPVGKVVNHAVSDSSICTPSSILYTGIRSSRLFAETANIVSCRSREERMTWGIMHVDGSYHCSLVLDSSSFVSRRFLVD